MNQGKIQKGVRMILEGVGENPNREGLLETPKRVAKAYKELLAGYHHLPTSILRKRFSVQKYDQMILVKNIDFQSLCEHHLLPFTGVAHIAYIPKQKVVGLSKIARTVEMYARRLQIQEQLTEQIADTIMKELQPRGVGIVISATHFCMTMRGVKKHEPKMITSALMGEFRDNPSTRNEFLSLVKDY